MPRVNRGTISSRSSRLQREERPYLVLSFSIYPEDDEVIDDIVAAERKAGRPANRSSALRLALAHYRQTVLNSQEKP